MIKYLKIETLCTERLACFRWTGTQNLKMRGSQPLTPPNSLDFCLQHLSPCYLTDTCPGERGDGAEGKGSAQPPRQRGGGRLTLPRTLMVIDELGQVGRWGGDEWVHQVRRQGESLAAEGGHRRATCKESATQEQRNRLQHELVIKTSTCKTLLHHSRRLFIVILSVFLSCG